MSVIKDISIKVRVSHWFILALLTFIIVGCSSSRKLTYEEMMQNAPAWVKQTPNNPLYYHGVAMVNKNLVPDYREQGRQNALSELAGGISVNISSTSVLNQFDYNDNSAQFFRDKIKVASQQYLEGYELVEEWENEQQYWVYYRLSKQRYAEVKQERTNSALSRSLSGFNEARGAAIRGRSVESIGLYIKAVENIRDFLGEDLRATIDGTEKVYATELIAGLSRQVQSVRFDFGVEYLTVKAGAGNKKELRVRVTDENDQPVPAMPVNYYLSWLPGNKFESVTDASGFFTIKVEGIKANASFPKISCQVDMSTLTKNATSDVMVQRLFSGMKTDLYVLSVDVVAPIVFLSVDTRLGRSMITLVTDEFTKLLVRDGISLTRNIEEADMIISTVISSSEPVLYGNSYSVNLDAVFTVTDQNETTMLTRRSNDISGLSSTASGAIDNAMQSLLGIIRITVYPQIAGNLF